MIRYIFEEMFVIVVPIFVVIVFAVILVFVPNYYSSCREARVYNMQNNTTYTCSDFFWAGEQINSQTQTIRLNSLGETN